MFFFVFTICRVYSYIMYSILREFTTLSPSFFISLEHEINSTLVSLSSIPFRFLSALRIFRPVLYSPRARGHTRAHAHTHTRSRSLANDMACPTVINHLSSRYRRISCVVSMRLQGSPPFLPLLPSAPPPQRDAPIKEYLGSSLATLRFVDIELK